MPEVLPGKKQKIEFLHNNTLLRVGNISEMIMDIEEILNFYMGKNTPQRQGFIIDNLKVEEDYFVEES